MTSLENESHPPASQQSKSPPIPTDQCFHRKRRRLIACLTMLLLVAWFGPKWFAVAAQWQARQQLVAREPEKALWWLDLAATVFGENADERFLRARAQRKLGRLDLTRSLLVQAFELGYRREALEREAWLSSAQAGELRQAEPHLEVLLTVPLGDTAEICEAYVNGFGMNDRFDDALRVLETWISECAQDAYPHYLRGRILRVQKRTNEATDDFQRALHLKPSYHAVALELGEIYAGRLELDEALRFFQIARMANSEVGLSAQIGQAQCYRQLGQPETARQILGDVLTVEPSHTKALLELSHIDLQEQRLESALQNLRLFYALQPQNIEARNILAQTLQAMGEEDEAREHFKFVAAAQSAIHERKPALNKVLESRFDDLEARYELGLIYLQYESEEKGLQLLTGVLESNANHRPTLEALLRYHDEKAAQDPRNRMLADRFRRKLALSSEPSANQRSDSELTP